MNASSQGKQEKPLVSVVIPVYNGAEFLREAIDSARLQSYGNLEIIVVDDGSTDDSLGIAQSLAASDPRIRVLTQPNAGVAAARNLAIAEACGEFIAPLDADDLWLPGKLDRQVRALLAAGDECGFVYSWWAWIDADGKVLDRSPRWTMEGSVLQTLVLINFTGNASVPLFRKGALLEAGGYNPALAAADAGGCEDWEVTLRLAAKHRVALVPEILLGYRRRPGSMSQACETMWRSKELVMAALRKLCPELKPALFRGSDNQFSMYLAGLSYWSGNLREAVRWGLRSGLKLPVLTGPYVARMMLRGKNGKAKIVQRMRPGENLDTSSIAEPLLPYDRILSPRQIPARLLGAALVLPRAYAHRTIHSSLLRRVERERPSSGMRRSGEIRILATACWHFPIYSQTFVYREVKALADAGFDVRFVYAGESSRTQLPDDLQPLWKLRRRILYAETTATRDFEYFRARMPEKVKEITRSIAAASGLLEEELAAHRHFRHAFSFARFAEAWQPDYLHTYFFYEAAVFGFVAGQLLGIPRGVSCYADHMVDDYDLKLVTLHLDTSDVVVATSARIKRELEELSGRALPHAIVKPNGVDARSFETKERAQSLPGRVVRGVAVNRIHAKKGVRYLLEAVLQLRERGVPFAIEILGEPDDHDPDGPAYFAQLRSFVVTHALGKLVTFRGRASAVEVRASLLQADIFVAPFVELANGDKDGIPTALLEAMAAGCAIVATDAGSITEVVVDANGTGESQGLLVPQRDSGALADAIARLCGDEALRRRLGREAMTRVRREFDVSVLESSFHERIRAAVSGGSVGTGTELLAR